jgi:hypothetical protein
MVVFKFWGQAKSGWMFRENAAMKQKRNNQAGWLLRQGHLDLPATFGLTPKIRGR